MTLNEERDQAELCRLAKLPLLVDCQIEDIFEDITSTDIDSKSASECCFARNDPVHCSSASGILKVDLYVSYCRSKLPQTTWATLYHR